MGTASRQLVGRINNRHEGMESSHTPKLHSHRGAKDPWPLLLQHSGATQHLHHYSLCDLGYITQFLILSVYKDKGSWKVCCADSLKYEL